MQLINIYIIQSLRRGLVNEIYILGSGPAPGARGRVRCYRDRSVREAVARGEYLQLYN